MVDIKKLFYEHFLPEAAKGRVDVFLKFGIAFSTNILEDNITYKCEINSRNALIPTLFIKNKKEFDALLEEYITKAMNFYDDENFFDEILDYKAYDEEKMICKEKAILARLFVNAVPEDFNDPVNFLRRRMNFLDNYNPVFRNLGFSDILGANLELYIKKDTINNETPSEIVVRASDGENSYVFPKVKFGISNDTIYIYAIQNDKNEEITPLRKKINRKLYKIGTGFKPTENDDFLEDITASFLVVLNIAVNYFKNLGYTKFMIPSILIMRWNAKIINNELKHKRGKLDDKDFAIANYNQEVIQYNLTDKLLATFARLGYHYNNISFSAYPYEADSYLHMDIDANVLEKCNNPLLLETTEMVKNSNKKVK